MALAQRYAAGYNRYESTLTPSNVTSSPVTPGIRVKVLFFGRLKEVAGVAEEFVELAAGSRIEDLFAAFVARRHEFARYRGSVVASRNQEFAAWSTSLHSGDEIAFLPPVSGG
jgi:molybdopterin converting factor subunit 1